MGLRIDIVTIFPAYFESPLGISLIGKAAARGDIEFRVHDLRRWARDVHHTVDDVPFGGGPGMVMKPDVWGDALDEIIPPASGAGAKDPLSLGLTHAVEIVRHTDLALKETKAPDLSRHRRVNCHDLHQRLSCLGDDERLACRCLFDQSRQMGLSFVDVDDIRSAKDLMETSDRSTTLATAKG